MSFLHITGLSGGKKMAMLNRLQMMKKDDLIAVLMGGPGSEREVSLASGKAVLKALQEAGYQAVAVDVSDFSPTIPGGTTLAFNVIHGTFGEDGGLQAYLEDLGIPYTGAGLESSRIAFDKALSKEKFVAAGVPTPKSEILDCSQGAKMPKMPVPFVVKPPREGSSVGIHIVKNVAEAMAAIVDASRYSEQLLIEEFVEGRELTVAIVGDEVFPVIEIKPPADGWYDMATKYPWLSGKSGGSEYLCPAPLSEAERTLVQEVAKKAHDSLGIEVYSRVDVLFNSSGDPYVLEANTIPGMTESSLLPKAAAQNGYDFAAICVRIAELSLAARS